MYFSKLDDRNFIIRLKKGERVNESISKFCRILKISTGYFTGIGAVEELTLAHYDVAKKEYTTKEMDGAFEVTNMTGNVAIFEGISLVHTHMTVSDNEMKAFGGHLMKAKVYAGMEVMFRDLGSAKLKKEDEETGLKLFQLDDQI
jgi:uncharacterized protein